MPRVRIAAVGDVMCGESFYQYGRGPRTHITRLGETFLDQDIVDHLRSHDMVLANFEGVASDIGWRRRSLRSSQMRASPAVAGLLRSWGFTTLTLANNHILEHGRQAAMDTARRFRDAGLAVVGAGRNDAFDQEPGLLAKTIGDLRVAILAGCPLREKHAFDGGASMGAMLELVDSLARDEYTVIVALHWGTEYMDRPGREQRELAHRFVQAGASLIFGHHPHVCQGVEEIRDSVIAYSLGNFIFDQVLPDTRWSAILSIEFENQRCVSWRWIPVVLDQLHRPALAEGRRKDELLTELDRRCLLLEESGHSDEAYLLEGRRRTRAFRVALWKHIARSILRFRPGYAAQLLARPILRRVGRC